MEKFKATVKKRILLLIILALATAGIAVFGIVRYIKLGSESHMADYIHGMQVGLMSAFLVITIANIVSLIMAVRNEAKLKKLYIQENDERTRLIAEKTGGAGITLIIIGLVLALLISSMFNMTVAATLAAVLIFVAIVRGALTMYYCGRFSSSEENKRSRVWKLFILCGLVLIFGTITVNRFVCEMPDAAAITLMVLGIAFELLGAYKFQSEKSNGE